VKNLVLKNASYEHLQTAFKEWLDILGYNPQTVYNMPNMVREFLYQLENKGINQINQIQTQYTTRAELLKFCKAETQNLFISSPPLGKAQNVRSDCKEIWKRLSHEIRESNSDFINFKQVRTSVITQWLKQFNLREVQYMAGHRYVSSTEGYLVNQTEDLQADIDQFYPF